MCTSRWAGSRPSGPAAFVLGQIDEPEVAGDGRGPDAHHGVVDVEVAVPDADGHSQFDPVGERVVSQQRQRGFTGGSGHAL